MRRVEATAAAPAPLTARTLGRTLAPSAVVIGCLVAASSVLRAWVGLRAPTPWINADEIVYSELGRSLYANGHLEVLDQPTRFYSLVYPAFVGLPLTLFDVEVAYRLLKVLQAVLMSLTCVPVYLWTRSLMPRRFAYAAAALTLVLPGLAYSGLLMTEAAFLPITVLAAWASARALERPTIARQGIAIGAILLAAATRLQALVLFPAFVAAIVLYVLFSRVRARAALAYLPALAGLACIAIAWTVWQVAGGGPATNVLGAYRAAGETSYPFTQIVRFAVYHLGDLLLLTGVIPLCATSVLAVRAVRGGERSPGANAYLAVTVAFAMAFVLEVGTFASRHVGRLAERDLLALAPLAFIGFALWLARGARVSRMEAALVGAASLSLLLALPMGFLVSRGAVPDAFTLAPLYQLRDHAVGVNLDLLVLNVAVPLLLLFVLPPRRQLWVVPAVVGVLLAGTSVSASVAVVHESKYVQPRLLGPDSRWIDRNARGPVTFLYSGESRWNAAYENVFWNRRIRSVYDLSGFLVPGPLPQTPVGPLADGRVVGKIDRPAPARYIVASTNVMPFGVRVADAGSADLGLWRVSQPFRIAYWMTGMDIFASTLDRRGSLRSAGDVGSQVRLVVYACGRGELRVTLAATAPTTIELYSDGQRWLRKQIPAWRQTLLTVPDNGAVRARYLRQHHFGIPGGASAGTVPMRQCTFDLVSTSAALRVDGFDFRRYR